MNMQYRRFATALAFLLVGPAALAAQKLEAGTWTGTVSPPGEPAAAVTYDVKVAGDTIGITLNAGEHGSFPFTEVKLVEGKLQFSWGPGGMLLKCELKLREDRSWVGPCTDPGGMSGELVMIPPKKD